MIGKVILFFAMAYAAIAFEVNAQSVEHAQPRVGADVVFDEENGLLVVEAEHFFRQSQSEIRQWFITSKGGVPNITPDPDEDHVLGASGNAYIEILPDTRAIHHADRLVDGENFSDHPGKLAVVHYNVNINHPGRYYVWVRAYSTGGEDNGLHVGYNGAWPAHGQRMQWCEGKNQWTWGSRRRTEQQHCGAPKEIYLDIEHAGPCEIQFSMREDGFEMDKFILTNDSTYVPEGEGPAPKLLKGKLPVSQRVQMQQDHTFTDGRDGTVYRTVPIGRQVWMAENLKYLPSVVGPAAGSEKIPQFYVYGYDGTNVTEAKATSNYRTYGVLYNWVAATANPSGVQGVCPAGWHLPSDAEWKELAEYVGGVGVAGSKLNEAGTLHWECPNKGATNEAGFTALPAGYHFTEGKGAFSGIGRIGSWWSATELNTSNAISWRLYYDYSGVYTSSYNKMSGFSVRCVRD